MKYRIFISSVQDEFTAERRGLKDWLTTDPFVSRFVESVFLFEDAPSHGKTPEDTYLEELGVVASGGDRKGTYYGLRGLSDIYRTSTGGTVNSTISKDKGIERCKLLKNKGKSAVFTRKKSTKSTGLGHGAKVSVDTANVPANVPANAEVGAFFSLVRDHPGKGTAFYAARLGKTRRTIKRYAAAVAELVEFRGGTKSGGYYIRMNREM